MHSLPYQQMHRNLRLFVARECPLCKRARMNAVRSRQAQTMNDVDSTVITPHGCMVLKLYFIIRICASMDIIRRSTNGFLIQ
jgi:hypothetical protein